MIQLPLPPEYGTLTEEELAGRIDAARAQLGDKLVILGHHYQRDAIVRHADFLGDSFKLCIDASRRPEAEFIIFCGVHFMAESADILTDMRVILPNLAAGCSMADMANIFQVRTAWKKLTEVLGPLDGKVMPITYINSAASLKAFVGEHHGTVCTSTNAPVAVTWALENAEKVLFFPDQHLGRNTADLLGYDTEKDTTIWDPFKPLGGNTEERLREVKFILWKGHCSVHSRFSVEQIEKARAEHPGIRVMVHPECDISVVRAADLSGSTEAIQRAVNEAESGSKWAIGTEVNLVTRLGKNNLDKTVFCLDPEICPCSTMYRIHPTFLCWVIEELVKGNVMNEIVVDPETRALAKVALDRMLALPPVTPK